MTKPPQFHRGSKSQYYTDDGQFYIVNKWGLWLVETRAGVEIGRAQKYGDALKVFAEWWRENGYDKREKEFGRW